MPRLAPWIVVLVCWVVGHARAQPADPVPGPTIVTGRVTDVIGRPVANTRVYVLPRRGEPYTTRTDRDGRYRVEVPTMGTHGVVIAIGKAHVFRSVLVKRGVTNTLDVDVELDLEGGEVIKIEDKKRPQPAVKPRPLQDPRKPMPYSEESVERDAWARAWLLLDVDEAGRVTRLKMLKKPGFDLEKIAIEQAFELRFAPALDGQGRPMKTYVLWTMEWPSWGWLVQGNGTAVHRPNDADEMHVLGQNERRTTEQARVVERDAYAAGSTEKVGGTWLRGLPSAVTPPHSLARVPCAGSGPLNLDLRNRAYRDCSQPDMSIADSLPWITRDTAETAILEMRRGDLMFVELPRGSRVPGYIALGITGTLTLATVAAFIKMDGHEDDFVKAGNTRSVFPEEYEAARDSTRKWQKITYGLAGATVLATGVSLFVWHRHMSKRSFSVQPVGPGDGAGASLSMRW